ncbi:MAG TPA: carbamoyltransferase C-terminal domain-containing protein [Vicinamibacterales bacterium]|jgi:carbamoyltransferase|nr:carbamoyltransferase C-terminal domain-containing protein [Vicinamibacterales bacterium]
MKILGISPLDKDSTVTVVENGTVTFAAGEERFTRVKLQNGFPAEALAAALTATGGRVEDFDAVVYPFLESNEETRLFEATLKNERDFLESSETSETADQIARARMRVPDRRTSIPGLDSPNQRMEKGAAKSLAYKLLGNDGVISRNIAKRESTRWGRDASAFHRKWQEELEKGLCEVGLRERLHRFEHHVSHAANAYFTSGFDEALIVTLDGYGSGLAGSVSLGRGGSIERLHGLEFPHSLGTFYETVTSSLGFKPSRHEGKIVGLAAYGDPEVLSDVLLSRVEQTPGNFKILEINNHFFSRMLASEFPKIDVAAAYQHVLERVACAYIAHYLKLTGARHVVLSGGVVANVKLNQRIKALPDVDAIFVHPNMGDGGCGTGAAWMFAREHGGLDDWSQPLADVYWGPSYTAKEIVHELQRAQLAFTEQTPIEPKIAQLIADGKVVARFNGAMEYGPRALGNRSILYHAKEPAVNQWLNQRLGRTEFMPFAPATLYERRHENYNDVTGAEHAAQFMTITFDCTAAMKRDCPAAVHVDGTARPQLVTRATNPSFHAVISEYEKLSGIPSVINTSFNMHEEPIVCSPADAIRAFLQGNLDYLAIGDFVVPHPSLKA